MRFARVLVPFGLVTLFGACNAILGNESEYVLVGAGGEDSEAAAGTAGSASSGKGGTAGSATSSGGKGAGAGGKAGSGAAGRGGKGGGSAAGEAGQETAAGAPGEAGAPSCVSRGAENCFNGIDDDCDGNVDCADSACDGPAVCQPAPSGGELGYFAGTGEDCPQGYTAVDLHQDLQAPSECHGCSCIQPTDLLCDSGVYGHGSYACPSYQFNGQLWDMYNDRCGSLPSDPNIHYYSIRGTSQCTPSGTPTFDALAWGDSAVFCLADRVGGGCGSGKACVPADVTGWCSVGDGGCSADYATDRGIWYEGVEDQRECSVCQCGLGTADCSASYIAVYPDGACGGTPTPLQSVAVQGDACGLAFGPQSGRIIGDPVPGSGSCQPNNFMTGEATPTNEHHVCCAL
jgi:hypothetical protein